MVIRSRVYRCLSMFVLLAFIGTTSNLECLVFADNFMNKAHPSKTTTASGLKLQETLEQLQQLGASVPPEKSLSNEEVLSLQKQASDLDSQIAAIDLQIQADFEADRKILSSPDLPSEGIDRYEAFIKEYEKRKSEVLKNIALVKDAKNESEAKEALPKLAAVAQKYSRTNKIDPLDVQNLPFRGKKVLAPQSEEKSLKDMESEEASFSYEKSLAETATPTAQDLAETEEILFHSEIIEAATTLQKNPIRMFRFVADKCEYQPYYGSMKGAVETFRQQCGNDVDLASLLMSLYRYSGIPCRYVVGQIDIPMDQALNYIGVEDTKVLGSVFASNGIPITTMTDTDTGKQTVRIKHYWVKAWLPSKYRGVGGDNSGAWIYLDPSYKQHKFTSGPNYDDVMQLDPISEKKSVESKITQNSPYSFNVDTNALRTDLAGKQAKMDDYFAANFAGDTPLNKMMNYIEIVKEDFDILPASLPYQVVNQQAEYASIPDAMRFKVTFSLSTVDPFYPYFTSPDLVYTANTPSLAGKRIIVGYIAASASDASVISRYGGVKNTPASAANLKPSVRIDGVVKKEGSAVGVGYDQTFEMRVQGPDGQNDLVSNTIVAGSYHAVAFDLQGVAPKQTMQRFDALKAGVDKANALIAAASATGQTTVNIDRDELAGEFLSVTGMVYWTNLYNFAAHCTMERNVLFIKGVSEAICSFGLDTEYVFGLPRRVSPSGTGIDVDLNISIPFNRKGTAALSTEFSREYGHESSVEEHSVFDQMLKEVFGTTTGAKSKTVSSPFLHQEEAENYPTISAEKALRIANDQGIPIYSLDTIAAYNAVKSELRLMSNVQEDVVNSLNAGLTAIIHQRPIDYYGWHGMGYFVIDPQTGAGAYRISSGSNGGEVPQNVVSDAIEWLFGPGSVGYVISTVLFVLGLFSDFLAKTLGLVGAIFGLINLILELKNAEAEGKYCPEAKNILKEVLIIFGTLGIMLTLVAMFTGPLMTFVLFIIGLQLSLAIDILKIMIPIVCEHIHALDNVRLQLNKIYYGWLHDWMGPGVLAATG